VPTVLLFVSLFFVSTYSAGLTIGLGPSRVAEKFDEKIVLPLKDKLFGSGDKPTHVVLQNYAETACPVDDYIAIALFGQSNSTNTVEPAADPVFPVNLIQYDWKSTNCYQYQEPLLGADFKKGNSLTYAAIEIAESTDKPVVIIPFGFGPSSILEWAYGRGSSQLHLVLDRLKASGISPQVFLWHQGESDLPVDNVSETILADASYFKRPSLPLKGGDFRWGLTKDAYKDALTVIAEQTIDAFPDTHFGIALVSIAPCLGREERWQPLRDAQSKVAAEIDHAFISADSDSLSGPANRYDTCHFSKAGAERLSAEYMKSISDLGLLPTSLQAAHSTQ
jgi:hypothetical protein